MVKTLPSSARDVGSIPVQEAKSTHAVQPKKNIKQKQYCITNSMKTFRMVHIKNFFKFLKKKKKFSKTWKKGVHL